MFKVLVLFLSLFAVSIVNAEENSVQNLAEKLNSASDYEEFRKIGSTKAITKFLNAQLKGKGAQELCRQLDQLNHENKSHFANSLLADPTLKNTACLKDISARFEAKLQSQQKKLMAQTTEKYFVRNEQTSFLRAGKTLGPSKARYLPANSSYNLPWDDPLPKGTFALTFDDGPHPTRTRQILDILDRQKVKATFFVLGQAIDRNPQIVRDIARRGHNLGGHTYTHPDLARRSYSSAVLEIERGFKAIERSNADSEPFFRFPYGSKTRNLMNYLKSENLHHFFWRVDTLDWKKKNPDTLLNYAVGQTVNAGKGIILFHDIHPQTVAMLPAFLSELQARGYKIVIYKSR